MWKEFQLINSFTLESSFCGPSQGLYKDCHFTISILKDLGRLFCTTLIDYASNEPKVKEAILELESIFPPSKAEEGLSLHFQQNQDNNLNKNDDDTEVEKTKNNKNNKKKGAAVKGGVVSNKKDAHK